MYQNKLRRYKGHGKSISIRDSIAFDRSHYLLYRSIIIYKPQLRARKKEVQRLKKDIDTILMLRHSISSMPTFKNVNVNSFHLQVGI